MKLKNPRAMLLEAILARVTAGSRAFGSKFVDAAAKQYKTAASASRNYRANLLRDAFGNESLLREVAKGLGTQLSIEAVLVALDEINSRTIAVVATSDGDLVDAFLDVLSGDDGQGGLQTVFDDVIAQAGDVSGFDMSTYLAVILGALINRRTRANNGAGDLKQIEDFRLGNVRVLNVNDPSRASVVIGRVKASAKAIATNPLAYVYGAYGANGFYKAITGEEYTFIDAVDERLGALGDATESAFGINVSEATGLPRQVGNAVESWTKLVAQRRQYTLSDADRDLRRIRAKLDSDGIVEVSGAR